MTTAFYFLALISIIVHFLHGYAVALPIDPWDENFYIWLTRSHQYWPQCAPIYVAFGHIFDWMTSSPQQMYYLWTEVHSALLPLAVFIFCSRMSFSPLISFLVSTRIFLSDFNLLIGPKVCYFNTTYLLLIMASASFIQSRIRSIYFVAIASLIGIFIRQDDLYMSLPLLVIWLILTLNDKQEPRQKYRRATIGTIFYFSIFTLFLATPITPFPNGRTWEVFQETFYIQKNPETPSQSKQQYVAENFGQADSVISAIRINPGEVFRHMKDNVRPFFQEFKNDMSSHFPLSNWSSRGEGANFENWLWSFALLISIVLIYFKSPNLSNLVKWPSLLVAALSICKCVFIALFLLPWAKYFNDSLVIAMIAIAGVISAGLSRFQLKPKPGLAFMVLLASFYFPSIDSYQPTNEFIGNDEVRRISNFVLARHLPETTQFYSILAYKVYINPHIELSDIPLFPTQENEPELDFAHYLQKTKTQVVILDSGCRLMLQWWGHSAGLEYFEKHFGSLGYYLALDLGPTSRVYFKSN